MISVTVLGQYNDTVYIDPNFTGIEQGTIVNPYKSLDHFIIGVNNSTIESNTVYLFKRGTTDELFTRLKIRLKHNIKFGAYGTGKKPILKNISNSGGQTIYLSQDTNIIVEYLIFEGDTINYHAYSPDTGKGIPVVGDSIGHSRAGSAIRLYATNDFLIDSCIIRHCGYPAATPGISIGGYPISTNIKISRCEIYDMESQGIGCNALNATIEYCHIYNTNMQYDFNHSQWFSAGAPMWIGGDSASFWHVHHCILDKSMTGNKFCFIHTTGSTNTADPSWRTGIFEYNTVITPKSTSEGGSGVYIGNGWNNIYRYNIFTGEQTGMTIRTRHVHVYQNVFYGFNNGKACIDNANAYTSTFYNNVFYDSWRALWVKSGDIKNNIFIDVEDAIRTNGTHDWVSDYNSYYNTPLEEDIHYITDYPQFVDTTNKNFHLVSTSPCIDVGIDVGLKIDGDKTTIPQGIGYDIGVYEYIQSETPELPIIVIDSIYDITSTSVKVSCTVISEGSSPVIERGTSFDNGDSILNIIDNRVGLGNFIVNPDILTPNTHYNVTGYAISDVGIYKTLKEFTTKKKEENMGVIRTVPIFNILPYSISTGIKIISTGSGEIIDGGICYKYIPLGDPILPPTINDILEQEPDIKEGSNGTIFIIPLTELDRKIPIYLRSYFITSIGTVYGEMLSVPIIKTITNGTFILENENTIIIEKKNDGSIIIK
jgi:hypothetical protein